MFLFGGFASNSAKVLKLWILSSRAEAGGLFYRRGTNPKLNTLAFKAKRPKNLAWDMRRLQKTK